MNILFCGDIVGSAGRDVIKQNIKNLRKKLAIDCVIANAENAAHGFGITPKIYDELMLAGVDVITLGNHFLDQNIIADYLNTKDNIVRPINYKGEMPGKGYCLVIINNIRIMVVNLMGALFMGDQITDPFIAIKNFLNDFSIKNNADIIIVDFHAETTSEKNAIAMFVDGKVSGVFGTHTHIPTLDSRILPKGTAFQTDVGMCGDYNSVIGMSFESSIAKFMKDPNSAADKSKIRIEPAIGSPTLSANLITVNEATGLATKSTPIILGANLKNTI